MGEENIAPVSFSFRPGRSFKRPFSQKPWGFSNLAPNVCGRGYENRMWMPRLM